MYSAVIQESVTRGGLVMDNTSPAALKRVFNRQQAASYVDDSRTGNPEVVARTWSVHQYQMEAGVWPRRNAGHGMSDVAASRSITHASSRG